MITIEKWNGYYEATIEVLGLLNVNKTDIGVVHQGRCLKCLPGFLVGKPRSGQFA